MILLTPETKRTLVLTGPRLLLSPLRPEDTSLEYVSWLNDPEVNQYLESRFTTHTLESTRAFVEHCWQAPHTVLFAIRLHPHGRHIGNIKLGPIDPHHLRGDIGLMIGNKTSWGQGYATEAISLLSSWALSDLGLTKVTAGAYACNTGSIHAFLRCGFIQEGLLNKHAVAGTSRTDVVLMAKLSESS